MNKKPSTLIVDYGHGYLYPNLGPVFEFPNPLCDLWLSVEAEDYLLFYILFRILTCENTLNLDICFYCVTFIRHLKEV